MLNVSVYYFTYTYNYGLSTVDCGLHFELINNKPKAMTTNQNL